MRCHSSPLRGPRDTSSNATYPTLLLGLAVLALSLQGLSPALASPASQGTPLSRAPSETPLRSASPATTLSGIDVSSFQGGSINWASVKSAGNAFAFARAVEYYGTNDVDFSTNMVNGKAAGVYMGAYDFVYPASETATTDADYFNGVIKPYVAAGYMYPALDLEESCTASGGTMSAAQITAWVNSWGTEMKTDLAADGFSGVTPIIYMNSNYASNCIVASSWGGWHLWIAEYYIPCATSPAPSTGVLSGYSYWQWCSSGSTGGISPVDQDIFNGALSQLQSGFIFGASTLTASYGMQDLTTGSSLSCGGTFAAGDSIRFTATVSGGTSPYTYAWAFGDGATGTGNPVTHVYTKAATGVNPLLTVTDAKGTTATSGSGCSFTVTAPPTLAISSFTASPASIPLGGTTYLNVSVTGGISPYVYAYSGLPTGCSSANTASLACAPSASGSYTVTVSVTDASSQTASKPVSFTVTSVTTGPAISSFTALPATIPLGGTAYLNVTASGGRAPFTYAYSGLPSPCASSNSSQITCTPGAAGTYTVMVTVTDMNSLSAYSNATFAVSPGSSGGPTISAFSALPSTLYAGDTLYVNTTAAGGTTPYTYAYSGLPAGCTSSSTATYTCQPTSPGTSSILVTVTDASSLSATSSPASVTVYSLPSISAFTVLPATIPLGGTTYVNTTAAGGSGTYTYAFAGLPAGTGCTAFSAAFTCVPTTAGTYTVTPTVTDSNGRTATGSPATLTVTSPSGYPTISSFSATPATLTLGASANLSVSVSGGTPPYSYTYLGLPPGCASVDRASFSCTPTSTGSFGLFVNVTDTLHHSVLRSTSLNVTPASISPLTITAFTAQPATVANGSLTYLNVTATGGVSPYTYVYQDLPSGCQSASLSSLQCVPVSTGSFTVGVTVTDAKGHTASTTLTLTVTQGSSGPGGPTGGGAGGQVNWTEWLLIGAIVAAILATGAVLVAKRRKKEPEPAQNIEAWQFSNADAPLTGEAFPPPPP